MASYRLVIRGVDVGLGIWNVDVGVIERVYAAEGEVLFVNLATIGIILPSGTAATLLVHVLVSKSVHLGHIFVVVKLLHIWAKLRVLMYTHLLQLYLILFAILILVVLVATPVDVKAAFFDD